jgi:hypothetical protein
LSEIFRLPLGISLKISLDKRQECRLQSIDEDWKPVYLSGGQEGKGARREEQEGFYDAVFPASIAPNYMATLCPQVANKPKAENILKTKDRNGAFPSTKAESILKR